MVCTPVLHYMTSGSRNDLWGFSGMHHLGRITPDVLVSDIAIFVLKRDVKLQLTN